MKVVIDTNILLVSISRKSPYNWNYLTDQDDNKFVDCAVAGNANFIVTHDNGFKQLAQVNFPKIEVIDSEKFKAILGLAS